MSGRYTKLVGKLGSWIFSKRMPFLLGSPWIYELELLSPDLRP
jgi:hypothetical protein